VSLLADEDAETLRDKGAEIGPGDFGENVLTRGIVLSKLRVGDQLRVGDAELEVTQIGKKCHTRCAIYDAAGTCVMPTNGVFCRVTAAGRVRPGDPIWRK
jgi:MOSC domain-containing protein YiiM